MELLLRFGRSAHFLHLLFDGSLPYSAIQILALFGRKLLLMHVSRHDLRVAPTEECCQHGISHVAKPLLKRVPEGFRFMLIGGVSNQIDQAVWILLNIVKFLLNPVLE
jgi:hypothetical protein